VVANGLVTPEADRLRCELWEAIEGHDHSEISRPAA
jgi:hypothetical protein